MTAPLVIATRESRLALWQAQHVRDLLVRRFGDPVELLGMTTRGDQILDRTLAKVGGKGLFVKELEAALEEGRAQLAVHSLKDVPMDLPAGFELAAVLEREDPRDAFVSPRYAALDALPRGAKVGTSSLRRVVQLGALRPDLVVEPLRGNLDTRLRKLDAGEYDALVLAAAGLRRLDRGDRISSSIAIADCVPAPGQGIIAIETRVGGAARAQVEQINDLAAGLALRAERAVITTLGGGCQMPIGAHADVAAGQITLTAIVTSLDGQRVARAESRGTAADPEAAGTRAAEQLLAGGADTILADVQRAQASVDHP